MNGKKLLAMLLILALVMSQSSMVAMAASSSNTLPDLEFEEGIEDYNECLFYGHNEQVIPEKKATCTATGLTEGSLCTICGQTVKAQEVIPALGHRTVTLRGQEPSCTDNGYTAYIYCLVCKEVFSEKVVIPATGHTVVIEGGRVPSCTEPGATEGKSCSVCGMTLTAQELLPALEHDLSIVEGHAATCTTTGLTDGKACSRCDYKVAQEVIPALDHDVIVDTAVAPTCTSSGLTEGSHCSQCKTILTAQTVIDPLGHDEQTTPAKAATFDRDGKTEGVSCKVCGQVMVEQTTVPKIASAKLSYTKKAYTGKTLKAPTLTVKDRSGKTLIKGSDYTVTGLTGKKSVGRYKVTVKFKGNYAGSKTLYFTIVPKKVASATATLNGASQTGGYDDVKFSWKKATGAKGYMVYYKKASGSKYTYMTATTKTSVLKKNLSDGVKYTFKVVPYYKTASGKTKYYSTAQYKTASVTTLKKLTGIKAVKSGAKVKISWKNINGETGYQISQATKKKGTKIVETVKNAKAVSKLVTAKKGKTYYYKVRAYKTVKVNGKDKKVYGPWSEAKAYKRK